MSQNISIVAIWHVQRLIQILLFNSQQNPIQQKLIILVLSNTVTILPPKLAIFFKLYTGPKQT